MKTTLMIVPVALACVGCDGPKFEKWEIVQGTNGTYGFVNWDERIRSGFDTCEGAKQSRDWARRWSDAYDNSRNRSFWKKAECP